MQSINIRQECKKKITEDPVSHTVVKAWSKNIPKQYLTWTQSCWAGTAFKNCFNNGIQAQAFESFSQIGSTLVSNCEKLHLKNKSHYQDVIILYTVGAWSESKKGTKTKQKAHV